VTDVLEVPSDSIRAQLEHALVAGGVDGVRVGALASARSVDVVFTALDSLEVPVVLDFVASGSSGETLLDTRGIDELIGRLRRADVVLFSRRDAELVSGGAIDSLDDAQVALQRIQRRGARDALIRCGRLATRFFDASEDPGGDGAAGSMESDLHYDGAGFTLLEAPHIPAGVTEGAASLFSVCVTASLASGESMEEALRYAKGYVTEAIRRGTERDGVRELAFQWDRASD
jgi:hydroxymethylpyrimidine/phosphomethylpyrimidine kinase